MLQRNIIITLDCFIQKNGKYLMLHRHKNKRIMPSVWMAPGGKREHNEGLFEGTRREVLEETGLKIKNLRIKASGNVYLKDLDLEVYLHLLTSDWESGKVVHEDGVGKLVWLTPKEIFKLDNLLSELHKLLPHIFGNSDEVISYKAVYEKGNQMSEFSIEDPR